MDWLLASNCGCNEMPKRGKMIFPSALRAHYSTVKKASESRINKFNRDMATLKNKQTSKYSLHQSKVEYLQKVCDMKPNPDLEVQ